MSAQMSERLSKMSDRLSGDVSERMSEDMPDRMSEDMQGMSSSFVRKNAKRFVYKQFVKLGVTGREVRQGTLGADGCSVEEA